MTDPITSGDRVLALADVWEAKARAFREYDEGDPKASVLERCAADLREMAASTTPDWVHHREIQRRTGWGRQWLYRRYAELEDVGQARRTPRGWEVAYSAAREIPVKRDREDLSGIESLEEMARILGRSAA